MKTRQHEACSPADAVFIGWQRTPEGQFIPLYNITVEAHPLRGSTVSDKTLRRLNLRIPRTPLFRQLEIRVRSVDLMKMREFATSLRRSLTTKEARWKDEEMVAPRSTT